MLKKGKRVGLLEGKWLPKKDGKDILKITQAEEEQPMQSKYSVKLGKVAEDFDLEVVYAPEGWEDRAIITSDINRPALQLTGFFE